MLNALNFIHLLSLVIWVGMLIFFTFFVAPVIFKTLPRETAGVVIGALFRNYWSLGYLTSAVSLLTLIAIYSIKGVSPAARLYLLGFMTVSTYYLGLVDGARARRIKAEIKSTSDEKRLEGLHKKFRRVHARSSALNLMVLLSGIVAVFLTALELKV
ncbi:MAG: DUF4149 domain-containing protein [Deltaproteobacteria bacterium]|nr:DUF4149 domain-containing protein [Deltaproteobacteria bacterium]